MAAKKIQKKSSKNSHFMKKHWWKLALAALLLVILAFFIESKYQDRQNVAELEQLLFSFEELKQNIEAESDQKLVLNKGCSAIEKFNSTYACYLSLQKLDKTEPTAKEINIAMQQSNDVIKNNPSCGFKGAIGFTFENSNYVLASCYPLTVRSSNINAVSLLYN